MVVARYMYRACIEWEVNIWSDNNIQITVDDVIYKAILYTCYIDIVSSSLVMIGEELGINEISM